MGGHIRGVVTQWQPPGRLAYTWNVYNPGDATSPIPGILCDPDPGADRRGTVFTLEHLPVLESFVKLNAMGWHTFIDMVDAAVRGGPVQKSAIITWPRMPGSMASTSATRRADGYSIDTVRRISSFLKPIIIGRANAWQGNDVVEFVNHTLQPQQVRNVTGPCVDHEHAAARPDLGRGKPFL